MEHGDYYQVLGVEPNASPQQIKEAYRQLAFKYHPDRNKGNPEALERMKWINEAYAVLAHPAKRREYDTMRRQFGSSAYSQFRQNYSERDIFNGSDINHIFEEMTKAFGFRGFDEIFREFYGQGYRHFEFKRPGVFGRGFVFFGPLGGSRPKGPRVNQRQFPLRGNLGRITRFLLGKLGGVELPEDGTDINDVIDLSPQLALQGGPYAYFLRRKSKKLVVKIPPGVREGQRIRLAGLGQEGKNGGRPGDLYLKVHIQKPLVRKIKEFISDLRKMRVIRILLFLLMLTRLTAFVAHSQESSLTGNQTSARFRSYWYAQGAEISRFSLEQARYGEIHTGDAVLIFVTEKMNPRIQVKAEHPGPADIPILKLNATRKFYTGIYPYSVMTSTFAPLDARKYTLPLKISSTTQEWCGNVYLQMNLRGDQYLVESHSYFEKEADKTLRIRSVLPEDALWTTIRLAPAGLPQGEFFLIPGALYTRLAHRPLEPQRVSAQLTAAEGQSLEGNPLVSYEVNFPVEKRVLKIFFEKDFPYRIQGWEDTHSGLKGPGGQALTTRAGRTHTILSDYWNRHGNQDRSLLVKLGLRDRQ
ncbi:MAG: J domain-containing protein [Desulfobacterales bacterium]|nr:MAG: J domain-containing protein [Desulfobacterales bacterium]